jgi:serine/threonine-protein kinase
MDPITRLNTALGGRYRIERKLGEGGMATVYLADDVKHERKVALKVLKPELAAVIGAERFLAEIKTTANLQHPHILPLHDSGEADGLLFYVMPYVEGESLRERLDRDHQLGVDESVGITTKVAAALQAAHERGVIHRDIKPANILLSKGEPLISDFGIALAVSAGGAGRLTETGLSLGTPHYMSPEQATGDQNVGAATDLYALGCVLYEMLAGEPPYTGSTPQAILGKIIQAKPVSATEVRQTVPANVDAVIRKALEKVPADRFRTASEIMAALGDPGFRHGHAVETAGATSAPATSVSPWIRDARSVATTTLAMGFALAFAWSLLRPEPPEPVARHVLSSEGWAGPAPLIGRYAALAPDGSSMIVPIATASGAQALGLKLRGSSDVTPIPDTERAADVIYSPDGQWIAYMIGSDFFKRPLIGGSALRLAEDIDFGRRAGLAWLDDGTILYEDGVLVHIPEDGGEPLGVVELGSAIWVHGLPGAAGALVAATLSGADPSLYAVDLGDLSSELLLEDVLRAWYAPTGHIVYVRDDGAVFAQPFDLGSLTLTGGAVPLLDGVRLGFAVADMRLAADGTLLYVEGASGGAVGSQQLVVVDFAGDAEALALAPRPIGGTGVRWSPDGESIVFESEGQIYTYNTVLNTTPRQITFGGVESRPVYSPDGTRVAFSSSPAGADGIDLFVKDLNDDAPPRSIITLDANQFVMGWPADTLIVFERGEGGMRDLWMVDISDPDNPEARPYLTSEADLERIVVSPDGTLAAYRSDESGQDALYVRSFPTPGERTIVYSGGSLAGMAWSPDGGTLYAFTGSSAPVIAVRMQRDPVPVVLGIDTLFTSIGTTEPAPGSVLHPDGDRFILAVNAESIEATDDAQEPDRLILVQNFFEELRQRVGN